MSKDAVKLSKADEYYANGQFDRAERLLYEIVSRSPGQWGAWHRLAAVCLELGKIEHAEKSARKAIELQSDIGSFHGRLGIVLKAAGKTEEAIAAYTKALSLSPNDTSSWFNLGNAYREQKEVDKASRCYQKAIQLRPKFVQALHNLANLLAEEDASNAALQYYQQCVEIAPQRAKVWVDYGNLLGKLDRNAQAIDCYRKALELDPQCAPALSNLGNEMRLQHQLKESLELFDRAIAISKKTPAVWNNRGITLAKLDRFEEAEANYQQALELNPNYANAFYNLGDLYTEQQSFDRGRDFYHQAIAADPNHAEAHFHLSHFFLRKGDFAKGWPLYEYRWQTREAKNIQREADLPIWDGSDPNGKTILVYTEQGAGDAFQFIRLLRELKSRGACVVLECSKRMERILAPVEGVDSIIPRGTEPLPDCDFQVPLLSLPLYLHLTEDSLPGKYPYLFADTELRSQWRKELSRFKGFKIGIAWQGSTTNLRDRTRSIPLKSFAPLAKIAGTELLTLQKGPGSGQLSEVQFDIHDLGAELDNGEDGFVDTAAVMTELDLVITSDTSIAHLAGGLGLPVWVALNDIPEWRWQTEREDSPWYPSMRLFRQRERGNWDDLFLRIAQALDTHVQSNNRI